eukprot:TRINITY_DN9521_c0_g1_i3.p3 TRINITY_DN9521_c0_g1~~TRINITY_DN9521_c0_g1_i3.p3  ORF type:complete len:185 (-),score=50.05 TRINITY_DN9521_c0_g1_i3:99-653(-)
MSEIIADLPRASANPNGLYVTKKLLSLTVKAEYEEYRARVVEAMGKSAIEMAQSPYGNYALQIVLDAYPPAAAMPIIEAIKGKVVNLSLTKYSSNVIERCIEKADEGLKEAIIRELMESENLFGIMRNRFGSYVVQKALAFAKPTLRAEFKEKLQSIIPSANKKVKTGPLKGNDTASALDFQYQ